MRPAFIADTYTKQAPLSLSLSATAQLVELRRCRTSVAGIYRVGQIKRHQSGLLQRTKVRFGQFE